jgi:hypothetical protein
MEHPDCHSEADASVRNELGATGISTRARGSSLERKSATLAVEEPDPPFCRRVYLGHEAYRRLLERGSRIADCPVPSEPRPFRRSAAPSTRSSSLPPWIDPECFLARRVLTRLHGPNFPSRASGNDSPALANPLAARLPFILLVMPLAAVELANREIRRVVDGLAFHESPQRRERGSPPGKIFRHNGSPLRAARSKQ